MVQHASEPTQRLDWHNTIETQKTETNEQQTRLQNQLVLSLSTTSGVVRRADDGGRYASQSFAVMVEQAKFFRCAFAPLWFHLFPPFHK
jgi:hypothetical protein